jgi:hypothetical protein
MSNKVELPRGWEWDGKYLKSPSSNRWEFDGRHFKPDSGSSATGRWEWDGQYIKPYSGSGQKWEVTSSQLRPYTGANSSNTFDRNNQPIAVLIAKAAGLF